MNYQIEKGVPVPPNSRKGGRTKYPFPEMTVGDSFFASADSGATAKRISGAAQCWAREVKKREGGDLRRFSLRTSKEPAGVRCWRVA